ncbi:MAG: hypothetical protein QXF72_01910 [Nitrososphaerota archaeon]
MAWLRLKRMLDGRMTRSEFLRRCINLALVDAEFLEELGVK